MSQDNVAAFERGVEAINRSDVDGVLGLLDPEVEFHAVIEELLGGEGRVYRGHDGYRRYALDFEEAFSEVHWEFPDIRDLGDRLLAIGRFRARGRSSGAETEVPLGLVIDFRNNLITRVWSTLTPEEALKAAGLSE